MSRFLALVYGVAVYLLFAATFLYLVGFIAGVPGLKTVDSGAAGGAWLATLVDLPLLALFGVQHSVMARRGFKEWWTKIVPHPVERSTYVLATNLVIALFIWQWRPIPGLIWSVDDRIAQYLLLGLAGIGWGTALLATFLINHFELFGLQQVFNHWRGRSVEPPSFSTPMLYRFVRHPLYLGFILGFWATPYMSVGHLMFAIVMTGYIFIGIFFEERDLVARFGDEYRRYRQRVPMILPFPARRDSTSSERPQRSHAG